jgi:CheY-like chemotaxis protein
MLTQCPFCQQPLRFSDEQMTRLEQALGQLASGKVLNLKCPLCRETIALDKTGLPPHKVKACIVPPPPPTLDWLHTGLYQGEEKVEDVPMALVLARPDEQRQKVGEALEAVGYQVFMSETAEDALERMRFVNFSCIVFNVDMEGGIGRSTFHGHMRGLSMDRRRYVFYILLGSSLHTLYDLEALACSANLTVGTRDLEHLDVILRKAIPAYEELFGMFLEEMEAYGGR